MDTSTIGDTGVVGILLVLVFQLVKSMRNGGGGTCKAAAYARIPDHVEKQISDLHDWQRTTRPSDVVNAIQAVGTKIEKQTEAIDSLAKDVRDRAHKINNGHGG